MDSEKTTESKSSTESPTRKMVFSKYYSAKNAPTERNLNCNSVPSNSPNTARKLSNVYNRGRI